MAGEILVNYEAVYTKTAELQQCVEAELSELDSTYRQVQSTLQNMDGGANGLLIETMLANQQKACVTADTLCKLLMFIDNSARLVERDELMMKRIFALSRSSELAGGGVS